MRDEQFLAEKFDEHRTHLRSVAYRMLGSLTDADDAIQEAWLRLARTDASDIGNLGGWLTTVVGRVCLDMLRSRKSRHEQPLEAEHLPDPVVLADAAVDPEQQALLADSVGLGLLIVLETLSPAERLAFVLHDMFAVPYEQIAPLWAGPRRPRRSWPARRAVESKAACRPPTRTVPGNAASSTLSSRQPARATSTSCSAYSTPAWCCAPTPPTPCA